MLKSYIEMFLNTLESEGKSQQTMRAYKNDLNKFAEFINNKNIEDVTLMDLNNLKIDLVGRKLKPTSINRSLRAITSFFSWAEDNSIIENNIAKKLKMIKVIKEEKAHLNKEQLQEVKEVIKEKEYNRCGDFLSVRNYCIISLLGQLGTRCSETTGIKIQDINLKTGELKIFGKGKKFRTIFINESNLKTLKEYICVRKEHLAKINIDSEYLLVSYRGLKLSQKDMYTISKAAVNKAGVNNADEISTHSFRHSVASSLLNDNVPIQVVSKILGHENTSTTLNIYSHACEKQIESAMKNSDL